MKTFKGLEIPEGLTLEKCEVAIAYGKSGNSSNMCTGLHARGDRADCGSIICTDCILRRGNLNTLIEYASTLRESEGGRRFRGYVVPSGLDDEKLRAAAANFNAAESPEGWCRGVGGVGCVGVECAECLLCDNHGDAESKRAAFAQFLESRGIEVTRRGYGSANSNMPELKAGMLAETSSTAKYVLIDGVSEGGVMGHEIFTDRTGGDVMLGEPVSLTKGFIRKLWWRGGLGLSVANVRAILGGKPLSDSVTSWCRVRKMTVDEVSRALGYTVEIVGNEKADDRL